MYPKRLCRLQDLFDPPFSKGSERGPVLEPHVRIEEEDHLHPGIVSPQRFQDLLQASEGAARHELPGRKPVASLAAPHANQPAGAPSVFDVVFIDPKMCSHSSSSPGSSLGSEKLTCRFDSP